MAYLLVFCAALLWGLIGVLSKGVLISGVSALEIAFWRASLAALFFLVHARTVGQLRLQRRKDIAPFAAFALVGVTLFFTAFIQAVESGGVSLATILLYTAPAFVTFGAWLLLGEQLNAFKLALVGLASLGVVLVAVSGGAGIEVSVASLTWGLVSGLSYAGYYLFGKWALKRYSPVTIGAVIMPLGALSLLPFVNFASKTPGVWAMLVLLAFASTYLAYLLYYTGLKTIEASRAVLITTIEPVVATSLAALIFAESFGLLALIGSILIIGASVLTALAKPQRRAAIDPL